MNKKFIYISLFAILYLIVAFSSFYHACLFFGLANNTWMSIILAFAFEIGQAAVLFSLLTSSKDRSKIMPWVLMTMFTLVQVIGNIFSSYKYILNNSVSDLKYFKEPIFIWTDLPDNITTVIVTYIIGAILPITALLLTSMITNYLEDENNKEDKKTFEELKPEKVEVNKEHNEEHNDSHNETYNDSEDHNDKHNEEHNDSHNDSNNETEDNNEENDINSKNEEKITEENNKEIIEEKEQKPEKTSHFINLK